LEGISEGSSKRSGRSNSCLEALEADEKGSRKGPEGPEKIKGWKPEGEGPVILLMHKIKFSDRNPDSRRVAKSVVDVIHARPEAYD
jgi:hypothetical protein